MHYPKADWVVAEWWVSSSGATSISRRALVAAWVARTAPPKPRKKEFVDEIRGWSGVFGSSTPWAKEKYGAQAAQLACSELESPDSEAWAALSELYADYVDTLARFTAWFAAAAHEYRPRGIPSEFGDSVKCYELALPPAVRAVMAGARTPDGLGGVVETERSATEFVADPEAHRQAHHAVAMRHYASVLRDKVALFQDDPDVCAAFAERIAALARYGTPEPPPRASSAEEEARVDGLLSDIVRDDKALRTDPLLTEAYLRARKTLLRWIRDGREVTDATIVYTKLRSARLDAARAERVIDTHESSLDTADDLPAFGTPGHEPVEHLRVADAGILGRARDLLSEYPAYLPGTSVDCWEKSVALAVLGEEATASSYHGLRAKVSAAWRDSGGPCAKKPATAVSATGAAAAELVDAFLFLAISSATQTGDLPDIARSDRVAARRAETDDILHALGYAVDDLEGWGR